jgi:hypothetical protein
MYDELGKMWRESVTAYSRYYPTHFPGRNEETTKILRIMDI